MSLKEKITPIDKYIDEALYNKKSGYYMKANPFGKKGDYITAPNISILFSEIIFGRSFFKALLPDKPITSPRTKIFILLYPFL